MRFALTVLFWLATTAALTVVVPGTWLQKDIIDADGYAALAQQAAVDPALQSAMTGELTTRAMALIAEHGGGQNPTDASQVHDVVAAFTAGPAFPPLFVQANRAVHSWLFTPPQSGQDGEQWLIDLAPMLNESSVQQMLRNHDVKVPAKLTVPLTSTSGAMPQSLHQGRLSRLASWGPWVIVGAGAATAFSGFLLMVAARRRGKALSSIGVSALLIGGAGWAGIELAGRRINNALNQTSGDIRGVGDVMVRHAEASLHQWLNMTLIAGATLVALGVIVAVVGSLRRRSG